jgi:FKBP-type peptidyl-prolyl cis-trans isomerase
VGTDKRERQKAGRQARIEQEMAAAKKQRSFRTARNVAIIAVVVVGGAFAYSTFVGGDDDNGKGSDETSGESTTTTVAESTTTTITYSDPDTVAEVMKRGEPKDTKAPPADTKADALEVTTVIEGKGDPGTDKDGYVVEYLLKKPDGSVVESSWTSSPLPIAAPLSDASLIQGWKEGLVGAKIGERRHLLIGSDKAYQDGTPLAFDIDILDIQRGG